MEKEMVYMTITSSWKYHEYDTKS